MNVDEEITVVRGRLRRLRAELLRLKGEMGAVRVSIKSKDARLRDLVRAADQARFALPSDPGGIGGGERDDA